MHFLSLEIIITFSNTNTFQKLSIMESLKKQNNHFLFINFLLKTHHLKQTLRTSTEEINKNNKSNNIIFKFILLKMNCILGNKL